MDNKKPELISSEELEDLSALLEEDKKVKEGAFQSPIMKKAQHLDVELLKKEIPHFRRGREAKEELDNDAGTLSPAEIDQLTAIYMRGQEAKEKLYLAALPLIKIIAHKEWKRRQQWASQIPYEDLIQDATVGFLKGLNAFRMESLDKSSTNYLGQWMLVEMRRSSEAMDHDLQVPNETGESFRKIRALRTRLTQDLGREPTDEEISDASRNPDYITRPTMVGKVRNAGEQHPAGRGVTVKQVAMEREANSRMGSVSRFVTSDGDKETRPAPGTIDPDRTLDSGLISHDPADMVMDMSSQALISDIVKGVIVAMELPTEQATVVSLRYGLPPAVKEHSVREICTATDLSRSRVTKIVNAFSAEMTTPGGRFHKYIHQKYSVQELLTVDMGWILDVLGPWTPEYEKNIRPVPKILTARSSKKNVEEGEGEELMLMELKAYSTETQAWYRCDFHNRTFSRLYENRRSVPNTSPCPACDKPSPLTKTFTG